MDLLFAGIVPVIVLFLALYPGLHGETAALERDQDDRPVIPHILLPAGGRGQMERSLRPQDGKIPCRNPAKITAIQCNMTARLQETFCPPDYPPEQFFAAGDLNLYYDVHHPLWHKRPDWFAVLGIPLLYEQRDLRLSYVVWQEGVMPYIVVELLSPSTEKEDLGQTFRAAEQPPSKWEVYEQILRIPYYPAAADAALHAIPGRGWSYTPRAGRWTGTPTAALFCTTWKITRWRRAELSQYVSVRKTKRTRVSDYL